MTGKKPDPKNSDFRTLAGNVATGVLAELLGLTQPAVSKLYQERVITQNGRRGKYDLFETIPKYIQSIRTSGTAEAGARLKVQQERKLRIANDVAAGELVKIDDAAEVLRAASISWRAGAGAIPRRLATELSNTADAAVCRELIANELDALFDEWEKPLREYFGDAWNNATSVSASGDGVTPSAEKDAGPMGGRKQNPARRKRGTRKMAK